MCLFTPRRLQRFLGSQVLPGIREARLAVNFRPATSTHSLPSEFRAAGGKLGAVQALIEQGNLGLALAATANGSNHMDRPQLPLTVMNALTCRADHH